MGVVARGVEPSEAVAKLAAVEVSSECGVYSLLTTYESSSDVGTSASWPSITANLSLLFCWSIGSSDTAACARGSSEPGNLVSALCVFPASPSRMRRRGANVSARMQRKKRLTHVARSDASPPLSCSLAVADANVAGLNHPTIHSLHWTFVNARNDGGFGVANT